MPNLRLVKKLSTKTIIGTVPIEKSDPADKRVHLYDMFGIAVGIKTGESNYGSFTAFKGEFRAVVPGGDVFQSSTCFVPSVIESQLSIAVGEAKGQQVKFAFKVFAAKTEKSPFYTYEIESLVAPKPSDAMQELSSVVGVNTDKLLPASSDSETPEKPKKKKK